VVYLHTIWTFTLKGRSSVVMQIAENSVVGLFL
jgi:hypothetical protein